jgi:hypothetical protein
MAFEVPGDPVFCDKANENVCTMVETEASCCCQTEVTEYIKCAFTNELGPAFGASGCESTGCGAGGDGKGGAGGGGDSMLLFIVVVVLLLCCCCGGGFYYRRRKQQQNGRSKDSGVRIYICDESVVR